MNDEDLRQRTQVASPAELAAAREARGMSQLDISQRIKLQVKQVNALEEGQWEALPGKSFVRGALRSYGKLLDVDVAPLLESIGGFAEPAQVQGMKPLDAPISRSSGLGFNGGGRGSPILWVIAGLIGVVALVLYFGSDTDSSRIRSWLPSSGKASDTTSEPAPPASPASPDAPSGSTPSPSGGGGSTPATPSSSAAPATGGSLAGANAGTSASASPGTSASASPGTSAGPYAGAAATDGAARRPAVMSNLQELPQASANGGTSGLALAGSLPRPDHVASGGPANAAGANAPTTGVSTTGVSTTGTPASGGVASNILSSGSPPVGPAAPGGAAAVAPLATASTASTASTAAPAPAVEEKGMMQVTARQDSWVEVRQADGTALHNGLLKAGSSIELKGSPPYRLVLGNASQVELSYEGKPQDLGPHTRANNIARLQLR